ncbi:replicative DNA helicase [Methylobacterium aquaticum]|uniref:replicative DNA helicase n=1 Tax=Methylobacterium aquaticum TaxID=270351 RepID=UPI00069F9C62|nr:replicative DNA helicase [Methylobacterium aquaticum]
MTRMQELDHLALRTLPADIDTEQALIGAVLIDNRAYGRVVRIVEQEHFFDELHRRVWGVVSKLCEAGRAATPLTLKTYLGDGDLGGMTVGEYLSALATAGVPLSQAADYARIVRDLAMRRRLISVTMELTATAYDLCPETTAEQVFAHVEAALEELRPALSAERSEFQSFGDVAETAIQSMQQDWQAGGQLRGLSTGYEGLDEKIGGLEAPDLIIIGGRPGIGKTALGLNIAVNVAKGLQRKRQNGQRTGVVGFFSLEMGKAQLFDRAVAAETGVAAHRVKKRKISTPEFESIILKARELRDIPLDIDETGGISITRLAAKARDLKKRRGLELLVIDYLQLVKGDERRKDGRTQEVTEVSNGLKELAKELRVPVIALAQVGRQVESAERRDRRPMLSDLRESGSIEQDADVVLFVYREDYYLEQRRPAEGTEEFAAWEREMARITGLAEVIVAKQRHGSRGPVDMGFDAELMLFLDKPPPREISPEETRQKVAKKPRLPAEATILYGLLRTLSMHKSVPVSPEQRRANREIPVNARLVPLDVATRAFGNDTMPGEADQNKINKKFHDAFKALRAAEIAFYTGTKEAGFHIFMPEMVND